MDRYAFPHYLALAVGLFYVAALFGLRGLRRYRFGRKPLGPGLVAGIVVLGGVLFIFDTATTLNLRAEPSAPTAVGFRRQVVKKLSSEPGLQLVLVRYAANHSPHDEIVYNTPDIDSQKIVWAFDFGSAADRPLLKYFHARRVWLVQPDGPHPTIEAYSGH